jgi:hypothetical protein
VDERTETNASPSSLEDLDILVHQVDLEERSCCLGREPGKCSADPSSVFGLGLGEDDASSLDDETQGRPAGGDWVPDVGRDEGIAVERRLGRRDEVAGDGEGSKESDEGLGVAEEVLELAARPVDGVEMEVSDARERERRIVRQGGARGGGNVLTMEMQLNGSVERKGVALLGESRAGGLSVSTWYKKRRRQMSDEDNFFRYGPDMDSEEKESESERAEGEKRAYSA